MFISKNQFFVFLVCVFIGGLFALLSTILRPFIFRIKNKFLKQFLISITYVFGGFLFILGANYYNFPNFRAYMVIGFFTGIVLYDKSLGIILAKFLKKSYNIITKILTKRRKEKHDGKQV